MSKELNFGVRIYIIKTLNGKKKISYLKRGNFCPKLTNIAMYLNHNSSEKINYFKNIYPPPHNEAGSINPADFLIILKLPQ